ncbi:putative transcription regulator [Cellulophaga algicola DSM 14237]|uniref:Transcription regulator n=1 Tax=Cellulophaga algicola (strain DSM 14237 / IC166 / ACAM 630) TaxID=688270 RepID=E6X8D7_CELAD|nr:transcriptional repressor [Cellulophaga algicola]ADV50793.1 putative transcription regulator [Cellulophaga algicola DSM 14237]
MIGVEQVLSEKGIRPTAMRILIYNFLEKQKVAVALSDIESDFDKAERTTVYRTLKTFVEKALVHQIEDGTGVSKYALCEVDCKCELDQDLHLHFHCRSCNETVCLTEYKIPHIQLPNGYVAEDVNLVIKGICERCTTL